MAERTCGVVGCDREVECRGWCGKHYQRWRKTGDPTKVLQRQHHGLTNYERFARYVDASGGTDACHEWTGSRAPEGYGWFSADGEVGHAHRWLLGYLRDETLGADEYACHHCDNPPCVNPSHLYVGDARTNTRDAMDRGRWRNPVAERERAQTHCKRGHDLADARVSEQGKRQCEICRNALRRERYRRAKAEA